MLSLPVASVETVTLATPALIVGDPKLVLPFEKLTVPVGVPVNPDVTVAVNVTLCPGTEGFAEDVSFVLVPPVLAFSSTPTLPIPAVPQLAPAQLATAMSGLLSPFRSAT